MVDILGGFVKLFIVTVPGGVFYWFHTFSLTLTLSFNFFGRLRMRICQKKVKQNAISSFCLFFVSNKQ